MQTDQSVSNGALLVTAQHRSQGTRARILNAALQGFARHGYDATGVAEICDLAGVSKGAFYHHFPTKQAVFIELMEGWLNGLDAQLHAIQASAENVPQALTQMAGMAGHVFREARGQLPMFLEFWSRSAREPEVWQALSAPYRRYQAFFCGIIEVGIAEGSLRPLDPEVAAQLLVSAAVGLVLQGLVDQNGVDWGEVIEKTVRLILEGMERGES
jgi:AcrR family transcriptional regulator